MIKKAERLAAPGACVLYFCLVSIIKFFVAFMLQKYFLLEAMTSEFYNSRMVSVFCDTNGMYFVDLLPKIKLVFFATADITFNVSSSFVSSFSGFQRRVNIIHDLREYESASCS